MKKSEKLCLIINFFMVVLLVCTLSEVSAQPYPYPNYIQVLCQGYYFDNIKFLSVRPELVEGQQSHASTSAFSPERSRRVSANGRDVLSFNIVELL